ncbi:MAG: trigger factor [Nitrospinales bacterium]
MKVEIESVDSCNKKIKLCIPYDQYKKRVDAYLRQVGKEAKIPGFRKGKIPLSMLEKRVGPEAKKEVLSQLVSECLFQAIDDNGIKAAGMPAIQEVQANEGTDINVSASVEAFPEFSVKDYSDIELEMKVVKVTEEDVDRVVELYRNRAAKSIPVTGRSAQDKDFLKIDYRGTIDGKPFPGSEGTDKILEMGAKQFIEGFEESLVGIEVGETRNIQLQIPDSHPSAEIAGKTADFQVTLKSLETQELPELNDEFARQANPDKKFENLADMRKKLREMLEAEERRAAQKATKIQLSERLAEINPVDIPEVLVHEQIHIMADQVKHKTGQVSQPGHAEESHSLTAEEEEAYRSPAIKLLRQELVIGKLTEDLQVKISDGEFNQEVQRLLSMAGGANPKKTRQDWQKSGVFDRIRARMTREKTLERLLEKIKVKEVMVDREKVIADN